MTTAPGQITLVTGSRTFTNLALVEAELAPLSAPHYIMHGGGRGADELASQVIHQYHGLIEVCLPYLAAEGRRGGFVRNAAMLKLLLGLRRGKWETRAIAFFADLSNPSKGTAGMVRLLQAAEFYVHIVDGKGK